MLALVQQQLSSQQTTGQANNVLASLLQATTNGQSGGGAAVGLLQQQLKAQLQSLQQQQQTVASTTTNLDEHTPNGLVSARDQKPTSPPESSSGRRPRGDLDNQSEGDSERRYEGAREQTVESSQRANRKVSSASKRPASARHGHGNKRPKRAELEEAAAEAAKRSSSQATCDSELRDEGPNIGDGSPRVGQQLEVKDSAATNELGAESDERSRVQRFVVDTAGEVDETNGSSPMRRSSDEEDEAHENEPDWLKAVDRTTASDGDDDDEEEEEEEHDDDDDDEEQH